MYKLIDGKEVSNHVKTKVREEVELLKEKGIEPALAVIIVGNDPASRVYVNNKKKACEFTGMRSVEYAMPEETTEEELKVAGIDDPVCTVTTTLDDGSSYVLKIGIEYGEEGNTGYIGYLEGTDILWLFDKGSLPWVGMVPEDAMASLIFGTYIYDLSSLTLITDAGTRSFVFDGNSADDYLVLLDGREYDLERYRNFYQALISAPAEQIYLDDLGATKKIATVILEKNDGSESETVEFFDAGNREVIISKNGKVSFKSRAAYIEKAFLPNIERLDTDEEFVTNW